MKIIVIYISLALGVIITTFGTIYASGEKGDNQQTTQAHSTQHPPHDHHDPDHIKKLDEGMRRKREDEEKSH